MKRNGQTVEASSIGSRQANMNKSFSVAIRSLLSACSKQDVFEAFPSFTATEKERLYRIYIQVVASLHGSMEDAFKTVCLETQIGTALNTVEQLVEDQELDPLHSEKTNVMDVAQNISIAKRNEVEHLTKMLQTAEKQNQLLRACVEALKKGAEDASVVSDIVETVRRGSANYALHSSHTNDD